MSLVKRDINCFFPEGEYATSPEFKFYKSKLESAENTSIQQLGFSFWLPPTFISFLGLSRQSAPDETDATRDGDADGDCELSPEQATRLAELLRSREASMLEAMAKLRTLLLTERAPLQTLQQSIQSSSQSSASGSNTASTTNSKFGRSGSSANDLRLQSQSLSPSRSPSPSPAALGPSPAALGPSPLLSPSPAPSGRTELGCLGYWVLVDADLKRPVGQLRFLHQHSFDVLMLVTPHYYYVLHDCYPEYTAAAASPDLKTAAASTDSKASAANPPDWNGFLERVPLSAIERIEISMSFVCLYSTSIYSSI